MSAETTQQTATTPMPLGKSATIRPAALPVFLTPQDVASMLQVNETTVLRWAGSDASMPVTRLGRVIRFEREPLLRWLARKRPRLAQAVAT